MRASELPLRALPLLLVFALGNPGCVMPIAPPNPSLSKFLPDGPLRGPGPGKGGQRATSGKGRITVGTGMAFCLYRRDLPESTPLHKDLYFFPAEGALTVHLARRYDLSFSLGVGPMAGVDGNVWLFMGRWFRLGLLHGVGIGFHGCVFGCGDEESAEGAGGTLLYNASAGLLAQVDPGGPGTLFLGGRYAYASREHVGFSADQDPLAPEWTHFIMVSLGYEIRVGRLRIVPELVFIHGRLFYTDEFNDPPVRSQDDEYVIMPSVSVAAGF